MHIARLAAPLTACLAVALAVPAPATAAASAPIAASGPQQRVLLVLAPQDRAALRALAHAATGRAASRAAALDRALPSHAQRVSVADTARSLGLTVDHVDRTAVAVHGPASVVRGLFGSARAVAPKSHVQHPLPALPQALRGAVTVALGGDDTRPAFHHLALFDKSADGGDLRSAYGDTVLDPKHGGTPNSAEQAETIATVQLSGWRTTNMSAYRTFLQNNGGGGGWPAPKLATVEDPFLPPTGHDLEVDLDQEAIYAVAPYAHQRAYLAGNDFIGMYDSLASIGDDASDPNVDRHLVAATVSWGFCETDLNSDSSAGSLYSAMEDVLSYDLATGVTVFGASGDNGGTCDGTHKGVSYPSSSPQVVAVGGTQEPDPTWTSGDPENQYCANPTYLASDTAHQQGWVDPTVPNPNANGAASGGGLSSVFGRPSYQSSFGLISQFRSVPDISALAGCPFFDIVTQQSGQLVEGAVGGTSLASPVAAATYAVQLAQHGYSWGIGDILPGLYQQGTGPGFHDVNDGCVADNNTCEGWNGADVAGPGYDQVTGLGTPVWSNLVGPGLGGNPHLSVLVAYSRSLNVPVAVRTPNWLTFDHYRIDVDAGRICTLQNASSVKPTSVHIDDFGFPHNADGVHELTLVAWDDPATPADDVVCHFSDAFVVIDTTKPLPTASLAIVHGQHDVVASWTGTDLPLPNGIKRYDVKLAYPGHTVFTKSVSQRGSMKVIGKPGKTYTLTVTATDRAGNQRTEIARLIDDRAMSTSRGWSRSKGSTAFDRTLLSTTRRHASASATMPGFAYVLYATTCSSCGKLAAYVSGKRIKTIDTYSARTHSRVPLKIFTGRTDASRKIVIKVLGSKQRKSRGTRVILDGLASKG